MNRVVAQLASGGFLEKVQRSRGNGGTTSCLYRLRMTPPEQQSLDDTAPPDEAVGTFGTGALTSTAPRPARSARARVPARAGDIGMTGPVMRADTPCQDADTSHRQLEHNNTPAPRAPELNGGGHTGGMDAEVPVDWEPSEAEMAEARRHCPDADLPAHTARFRARCRARGYRYRAGRLGDAWLAWLLEDHGVSPRRNGQGGVPSRPPAGRGLGSTPAPPALRFAAWAAAAAAPPAPVQNMSPWS